VASAPIKLIVGLGNPGAQYQRTRHNAGFWLLDELAGRSGVRFRSESRGQAESASIVVGDAAVHLLKPLLFMNRSGLPVLTVSRYRNIRPDEILVAHDELDFEPGIVRLKVGGGHGGHNGLRDLIAALGTPTFARIRLGIGHAPSRDHTASYVLAKPGAEDEAAIREAVCRVVDVFPRIVSGDIAGVMNELNSRNVIG
jgi:PTH1 family peptidyl-tRNA hydrolase